LVPTHLDKNFFSNVIRKILRFALLTPDLWLSKGPPAMEGTSDADPFLLNNSCGRKGRTVICGTCGGNHYRKTHCVGIEICDYL